MIRSALVAPLLVCVSSAAGASDWPRFRGPNGSGVADEQALPTEFGPDRNRLWTTPLPEGLSSPIVRGERVFVTALEDQTLYTYALDRTSGRVLWRRAAPRPRVDEIDSRNHPASPSPAADAEAVYVFFAEFGLLAYSLDGEPLWNVPLGPFRNVYGMGASPIVVDDKVILVCDQSLDSYVMAVSAADGEVLWKTERPTAKSGHSTPVVYRPPQGPAQLLIPGSFLLTAYSVETGERLWWVSGLSFEMKSTPVLEGDTLYVNGYGSALNQPGEQMNAPPFEELLASSDDDGDARLGKAEVRDGTAREWFDFVDLDGDERLTADEWAYYRSSLATTNGLLAIRVGGRGDVTKTNVRWTYHRSIPQLPSPLLYRGVLYMVNDGGVATALDPETGEQLHRGRLEGAIDKYYASPVAAGGKIYMASASGKVVVLAPDGRLTILAVNDLGEPIWATPAIADGRLYIRTRSAMHCFGLGES